MGGMPRYLVIVNRDEPALFHHLRGSVGSETIRVILDRRASRTSYRLERERRGRLFVERDLRRRDYVIVRTQPSAGGARGSGVCGG
jgi:hypothetical protein